LASVGLADGVEGLLLLLLLIEGSMVPGLTARCTGWQTRVLVQLRFPRRGAIAVDRREEMLVGRVVDVLALDGHLVTRHVIRSHGVWLVSGWASWLTDVSAVNCRVVIGWQRTSV